jgi:hypothetical protein
VVATQSLHARLLRPAEFTSTLSVSFPPPLISNENEDSEDDADPDDPEEDARRFELSKIPGSIVLAAPYSGKLHISRLTHNRNGVLENVHELKYVFPR